MHRSWTITVLRHEQPDDAIWDRVRQLEGSWPATADFMIQVTFDDEDREHRERLLGATGAAFHLTNTVSYDAADHAAADFVELLGVDGSAPDGVVVNEDEAFAAPRPCPVCGFCDALDAAVSGPVLVDETAADAAGEAVHLPNGHLLVNRRLAGLLTEAAAGDVRLHPVLDADSGRRSARWSRLTTRWTMLVPCPEHSAMGGGYFCFRCGTGHGDIVGPVTMRADVVGGHQVLSRHPGGGAMLYVGRRVHDLLLGANPAGVTYGDVLMLCRH
ncbi:hypothetical protein [Actinoplanes sp. DH11]|uniref:hypothetical protein n=1 Tax=Actinoplanes sp. DH11 TaxID=2857011 RepID=UPI001E38FDDB|nr:hypothetical protein [Actinoplanes sp. DH11]